MLKAEAIAAAERVGGNDVARAVHEAREEPAESLVSR